MALELLCPIKTYHWGKVGRTSLVAYLKQNADFSFIANPNESYAELWMGTHPSGPAIIKDNDMPLENWILQKPSILGEKVLNTFGNNLPFLFKILSINMPLSIQVHPSQVGLFIIIRAFSLMRINCFVCNYTYSTGESQRIEFFISRRL